MIIIDQEKIQGDFSFIGELHHKMIEDNLVLESIDEISPMGLVILQSGGFHDKIEILNLKDKMNRSLSESDYAFKTGNKKYKLKNLTFY